MRSFWRKPYPEYVHKIHYAEAPERTLCSVWKTCGRKKPKMTRNKTEVTCKICRKKLGLVVHIEEHFQEELFKV